MIILIKPIPSDIHVHIPYVYVSILIYTVYEYGYVDVYYTVYVVYPLPNPKYPYAL